MYVIVPCGCIFDASALLFDGVSASSWVSSTIQYLGVGAFRSTGLKPTQDRGLVRLDYNDVKLAAEEDTTWRLWFFHLWKVFIVVTYVTKDLICVPKFFHVDLLLLLLPDSFMFLIRGMLYSYYSCYIHIIHRSLRTSNQLNIRFILKPNAYILCKVCSEIQLVFGLIYFILILKYISKILSPF
jgi:hypothetical protein